MNWVGVAILAICGSMLGCGLLTGRIPASWPSFAADRDSTRALFRFYVTVYAIGALVGAVIIMRSLT